MIEILYGQSPHTNKGLQKPMVKINDILRPILTITYHPYLRPINKIPKNLQPLPSKDPHLNQIFPSFPLISSTS